MEFIQKNILSRIKNDFIAGVVVFLVAIPLCLGIALASGVPLFAGIISGIIGGIVVGCLSQSNTSVSGPAAGMIAVVLAAIAQLGSFENFLLALLLAGILQILIGLGRGGFIADYIPSNVIQGLLCAIGILIIIKQLPLAFTHTQDHRILTEILKESAENLKFSSLFALKHHIDWGATLISLTSLMLLIYQEFSSPGFLKKIPGPVLVVIAGIIINELYTYVLPIFKQDSAYLVNIPVNDNFRELWDQFVFPNWQQLGNPKIYLYGLIITAVASLETLLNLEATEKLDKKRQYSSRNRELIAQGIGNCLAGIFGGLPVTSVVVRSSVNIQAGAESKLSTIIHGFLFVLAVLFFSKGLNKIPLASLAAILMYVGYKLTRVSIYRAMYREGFTHYFPFIVTVITIVSTNILLGVIVGLVCSIIFILKSNSQMRFNIVEEHHPSGMVHRLLLPQELTFLKKASLTSQLADIPAHARLIIDARQTKYIDRDILELIKDFSKNFAYEKNIELNLLGFKNRYKLKDRTNFINVTTYDVQASLTPQEIVRILREGNQRFIIDQRINRYFPSEVKATVNTQHPLAVVLSCIDSRVPVETIFDMGVGDLFVVRVAGNVVNDDVIGSVEFACAIAHAKLILVLGHTRCGAVKAAYESKGESYIAKLLDKIHPAVQAVNNSIHPAEDSETMIDKIAEKNIQNSLLVLSTLSPMINKLLDEGKVGLMSAMYDVRSGLVTFFDHDVPEQKNIQEPIRELPV